MSLLSFREHILLILLISEVHNANLSDLKSFRCNNGKYIWNRFVCNGIYKDCSDGSDEFSTCDRKVCGAGKFKCEENGFCLNITARCNTKDDCPDGSDEWNCGDETKIDDCHFHKGKFLCQDKLKCLGLEYTCDGDCNCFDCSDENSNCAKFDKEICKTCPHSCFPTPTGSQCFCNSTNSDMNELCEKVEDCNTEYLCQQRCHRYKRKYSCTCFENYNEVPESNGAWCQSNVSHGNMLIYSTASKIKALNLTTNKVIIVNNRVECSTLTAVHNYIYYTMYNDNSRNIYKTSLTTKNTTKVVLWRSSISSIAVDYITKNLYFSTDSSIVICKKDDRHCIHIMCCRNVSNVALAPKYGMMFYTEKTSQKNKKFIMRSNMDGKNDVILLDGTFPDPTSLIVDEQAERLYWLEKKENKIYSISFTPPSYYVQVSSKEFDENDLLPSSITVFQKKILYAKNQRYAIYSMENFEDTTLFYPDTSTYSITRLYAYNPLEQSIIQQMENPCERTPCQSYEICALCPSSSSKGLNYTCIQYDES